MLCAMLQERLFFCGPTQKDEIQKKIEPTKRKNMAALQAVIEGTELFPSDMLPQMLDGFLLGADNPDIWLTCHLDGRVVGFCHAIPETLADGVWNMLAIAVLPKAQGHGCGQALMQYLEANFRAYKQRVLIADTSGTEAFAQTRAFYRKNGYTEEACIRDFWAVGDDKIVFWKKLS